MGDLEVLNTKGAQGNTLPADRIEYAQVFLKILDNKFIFHIFQSGLYFLFLNYFNTG